MKGVFIFSAPSGSGKTTILKEIFKTYPDRFGFSISATTRLPREGETHGKDYYFLSVEEMKKRIANGEFIEWEEVYEGRYYGTLRSEIDRIWAEGKMVVFDVDVKGGVNIKKMLGEEAFSIFVLPPSIEELRKRLEARGSETKESLEQRIARAEMEIAMKEEFDTVILNDDLEQAIQDVKTAINERARQWSENE